MPGGGFICLSCLWGTYRRVGLSCKIWWKARLFFCPRILNRLLPACDSIYWGKPAALHLCSADTFLICWDERHLKDYRAVKWSVGRPPCSLPFSYLSVIFPFCYVNKNVFEWESAASVVQQVYSLKLKSYLTKTSSQTFRYNIYVLTIASKKTKTFLFKLAIPNGNKLY